MIRFSKSGRPESWHTVQIPVDGEPQPMAVRYWLLSTREAARLARERLAGIVDGPPDEALSSQVALQFLQRELSDAHIDTMQSLLTERIVDWDLEDADAAEEPKPKLPVTPEIVAAILERGDFLRPLFQGLLDASSGAARKNA